MGNARRVAWHIVLGVGLLVGLFTVALGLGALLPPAANRFTMASSSFWTAQAPRAVVAALATLLAAGFGLMRGPRRLSRVVLVAAAVALLFSGFITARIVGAASAAGGSANPLSGLVFTSTDSAPDTRETYAVAGGQALSAVVYRPRGHPAAAPVIMYIHGGGWISGDAAELGHDMRWFADQGWLVISVDYRLATDTHATWDEAYRDVACALAWTYANAARWGGDGDRIAVAGDSAGGNLAVNLAYAAAAGRAQSGCGGTVPVPRAVVVQYPVIDPRDAYDHGYPARGAEPKMFLRRYIGGPPEQFPERMRAIASDTYISAAAPATLIVEPDNDGLIPTGGVLRFAQRARSAGVDLTVDRIPFANHAYDGVAGSLGNQAALTIRRNYLVEHGLAPLSPGRPDRAGASGRDP
jgi:acetyl esterase/lipase